MSIKKVSNRIIECKFLNKSVIVTDGSYSKIVMDADQSEKGCMSILNAWKWDRNVSFDVLASAPNMSSRGYTFIVTNY